MTAEALDGDAGGLLRYLNAHLLQCPHGEFGILTSKEILDQGLPIGQGRRNEDAVGIAF